MTDTTNTNSADPADDTTPHTAAAAAATEHVAAGELSELMDAAIRRAVGVRFAKAADSIAEEVVAAMLTPELREQMTETAAHEAELAINPPVVVDRDPDAPAAADDGPKPKYKTVEEFVERYVVQVFRRDVTSRNSDTSRRWCPQWWRHGEAWGRLEALWMAFEELRQGKGAEQSVFWINHFAPHMNALFDPDGIFKYCSATEGHHSGISTLPALPVVPFPGEGQVGHDPEPGTTSGLIVPASAGVTHRRVIRTDFP